jgi:hypothetical protein
MKPFLFILLISATISLTAHAGPNREEMEELQKLAFGQPDSEGRGGMTGTYYDFKIDKDWEETKIDQDTWSEVLHDFTDRKWDPKEFKDYQKATSSLYSKYFFIPNMSAVEAPKAYGASENNPSYWAAHYKGTFQLRKSGKFRFVGMADDILVVRVNGEVVLDASYHKETWSKWDGGERVAGLSGPGKMPEIVLGEWVELDSSQENDIEVLIGEHPGGRFYVYLWFEMEGVKYDTMKYPNRTEEIKILPVFRTAKLTREDEDYIQAFLIDRGFPVAIKDEARALP